MASIRFILQMSPNREILSWPFLLWKSMDLGIPISTRPCVNPPAGTGGGGGGFGGACTNLQSESRQCSKSEEVYSLCIRLSSCNCKSTSSPTRAQVCDASNAAAMTAFCLRPKACDEKLRLQNCQDTAQSAMPCLALVQGLTEGQTCRSRC